MIFSNIDILKAIEDKEITISPFSKESVRLASVELSLGNGMFYIPKDNIDVDILKSETYSNLKLITYLDNETINITPGEFVISATMEVVKLPSNIIARIECEPNLRSFGLIVFPIGEHLEPGFDGVVSFGIKNIGTKTIILRPGIKICNLVFEQLLTPIETVPTKKEVKGKAETVKQNVTKA